MGKTIKDADKRGYSHKRTKKGHRERKMGPTITPASTSDEATADRRLDEEESQRRCSQCGIGGKESEALYGLSEPFFTKHMNGLFDAVFHNQELVIDQDGRLVWRELDVDKRLRKALSYQTLERSLRKGFCENHFKERLLSLTALGTPNYLKISWVLVPVQYEDHRGNKYDVHCVVSGRRLDGQRDDFTLIYEPWHALPMFRQSRYFPIALLILLGAFDKQKSQRLSMKDSPFMDHRWRYYRGRAIQRGGYYLKNPHFSIDTVFPKADRQFIDTEILNRLEAEFRVDLGGKRKLRPQEIISAVAERLDSLVTVEELTAAFQNGEQAVEGVYKRIHTFFNILWRAGVSLNEILEKVGPWDQTVWKIKDSAPDLDFGFLGTKLVLPKGGK